MFKSRYTLEQKHQILKDFDSKKYTTDDLLKKYNVTLQTLYNWRFQFSKRARKRTKQQIMEILKESENGGIQATSAKHGLKPSTLYMWRYKYLRPEQQAKPTIVSKVIERKYRPEKVSHETEDELTKYKEACLALTFEVISLKSMLEKMRKQSAHQRNY